MKSTLKMLMVTGLYFVGLVTLASAMNIDQETPNKRKIGQILPNTEDVSIGQKPSKKLKTILNDFSDVTIFSHNPTHQFLNHDAPLAGLMKSIRTNDHGSAYTQELEIAIRVSKLFDALAVVEEGGKLAAPFFKLLATPEKAGIFPKDEIIFSTAQEVSHGDYADWIVEDETQFDQMYWSYLTQMSTFSDEEKQELKGWIQQQDNLLLWRLAMVHLKSQAPNYNHPFFSIIKLHILETKLNCFYDAGFEKLQYLDLHESNLASFAGNYPNLIELELHGNTIENLDGVWMPEVKNLYLHDNILSRADWKDFKNLELLWLSNNNISYFDGSQHPQLTILDIERNPIEIVRGNSLKNLKEFKLSTKKLTSFEGRDLGKLTNLEINGEPKISMVDQLRNNRIKWNQIPAMVRVNLVRMQQQNNLKFYSSFRFDLTKESFQQDNFAGELLSKVNADNHLFIENILTNQLKSCNEQEQDLALKIQSCLFNLSISNFTNNLGNSSVSL